MRIQLLGHHFCPFLSCPERPHHTKLSPLPARQWTRDLPAAGAASTGGMQAPSWVFPLPKCPNQEETGCWKSDTISFCTVLFQTMKFPCQPLGTAAGGQQQRSLELLFPQTAPKDLALCFHPALITSAEEISWKGSKPTCFGAKADLWLRRVSGHPWGLLVQMLAVGYSAAFQQCGALPQGRMVDFCSQNLSRFVSKPAEGLS